jgi:transketolase C-terminal domain/subunit
MACVTEIDEEVMASVLGLPCVVTYEDHNPTTGIAPVIACWLLDHRFRGTMGRFGVKGYGPSGDTEEILRLERLDVESMVQTVWAMTK